MVAKDGLPLDRFYTYRSGETGKPGHCGASSQVALSRTKKEDFLYKANEYGTPQNYEQQMDYLTSARLPVSTRIYALA
ncbi:hypothetical protein niasHS_016869 [Heterodera schachtii]|uniref:Uncharacterized protein n=1 Tax=Heterodera schachtii TaxID=97005 RepID=A0ABD2HXH2_HETSC